MQHNLSEGSVTRTMLVFAYPMILGNLLQQFYNVADTLIVFLMPMPLLVFMQIPADLMIQTRSYLQIIFCGIFFTFLYNFFASLSRSIGNSVIPLVFLALSTILNIVLDLLFILVFHSDVGGAQQ